MASPSPPAADGRKPFPQQMIDFDADSRVRFEEPKADEDSGRWVLDNHGEQWEFNEVAKKWFQPATDEEKQRYLDMYGRAAGEEEAAESHKRKAQGQLVSEGLCFIDQMLRCPRPAAKKVKAEPKAQENRSIYISNLPLDTTADEVEHEFKRWGIIDQGLDGNKRIKMYAGDDGKFNGTALVTYYKKDSVSLAINMADDSWFRPSDQGKIRVEASDMSFKKNTDKTVISKQMTRKDRKEAALNRADLERRLNAWSDDEDDVPVPITNKWAKVVIIKNAFTLQMLKDEPDALDEIVEDMMEEASKYGSVTSVTAYDLEPEGVIAVRFEDKDSAAEFIQKNNGRWFDKLRLSLTAAQDNPKGKFRKSSRHVDEEEQERLLESILD